MTAYRLSATAFLLGLLGMATGIFLLDRFTSFSGAENIIAVVAVTAAAVGLTLSGRPHTEHEQHIRGGLRIWIIASICTSVIIAAFVIRGDVRSWLLVAIVTLTATAAARSLASQEKRK